LPIKLYPIDIALIGQDALHAFCAHAAPILICACVGYAGIELLSIAVSLAEPPSPPAMLCAFRPTPPWPRLLLAVICGWGVVFTQAMISRLALQSAGQPLGLRSACRAVLRRVPALLLSWLVYGLLLAGIAVGLSVPLRAMRLDPANRQTDRRSGPALDSVVRELVWHGAHTLMPDPGSPFCEWAATTQAGVLNSWAVAGSSTWRMVNQGTAYVHTFSVPPALAAEPAYLFGPLNFWLVTLGSLVLLVLTETALRFRVIAAVQPGPAGSCGSWVEGTRLAWRHFGVVAGQVWLVRLVVTCAQVLLVGLPVALAQQLVLPTVSPLVGMTWVQPVCVLLTLVSVAVVHSVFTAFCAVYDARLFIALQHFEDLLFLAGRR
jgi:hypothetical protein